jgi:predicted ATPase
MIHLRSVALRDGETRPKTFPFNLPVVSGWEELTFSAPVTILVGENGSGKSTILESLAVAAEMITVGSGSAHRDPSLEHVRELAKWLKLVWNKRTRQQMQSDLERVEEEYKDRSKLAQNMARMPFAGQIHAMQTRYGEGLDSQSHGESFLALFQTRFVPDGLYLLDEPEAPLSPLRQLSLISAIKQMVEQNGQFIIATHSPILMAYPQAELLSFDPTPIAPTDYRSLEHVNLMRDFLNDPESFLRHL